MRWAKMHWLRLEPAHLFLCTDMKNMGLTCGKLGVVCFDFYKSWAETPRVSIFVENPTYCQKNRLFAFILISKT